MVAENVQGFKALPLQLSSTATCHNLYIREHSVRNQEDDKPAGLTLFVLNVPPVVTAENLKQGFSSVGKVRDIICEQNAESLASGDGFKLAYVVFWRRESVIRSLKLHALPLMGVVSGGMEKWTRDYNTSICDPKILQKEIDEFMRHYEEENKRKTKDVTDDEGWQVVTKGARKPGISRKESVESKLKGKDSKKKELKNFYTFQIRESQMKQIAALRKNYEEAKKKVDKMKQTRKFKPY